MEPLKKLIDANFNFTNLEEMMKKKEYNDLKPPEFRYNALEEEFCKYLTGICQIFKDFGTLSDHFNIKQMIKTMKIPNWRNIVPFQHYLQPL